MKTGNLIGRDQFTLTITKILILIISYSQLLWLKLLHTIPIMHHFLVCDPFGLSDFCALQSVYLFF